MAAHGFRERVLEVKEAGFALSNTVTRTRLLPVSALEAALPIGFGRVPRSMVFLMSGRISTVVTTPGTMNLFVKFGSILVFDSLLMPLNIVSKVNVHWIFAGELVYRVVGSGTTSVLMPKACTFTSEAVVGSPLPSVGGAGVHMLPYNVAPAVGAGFDNFASQPIDIDAKWSVADASNSIQLEAGHVDVYI